MLFFGPKWGYENIAAIGFGNNNVLIITPTYEQIRVPETLKFGPIDPKNYDVFVVKSRVHFRRGFDETGYAKTIFVVDAPGDWFGTIRLDALDYFIGPTMGYLVGFVVAVYLTGFFKFRNNFIINFIKLVFAVSMIYLFGI